MFNNLKFWAKTFENFISFDPIFEASTLSKTGMPSAMISAIHQKLEHWDDYPRMAHTYRGGSAIPMPFKYHTPAHDITIPEPIVFTGKKSNVSPFSGRSLSRSTSQYRDFEWYLENIKLNQNRILIANPDLDFYMFIYDKSRSRGATGLQYAILAWDKDKKKPIDFGYSELTTREVDLSKIRKGHDTKGGNTAMKIMEYIRSMTRESGEKDYAPSSTKPLYVYEIPVDATGKAEPRELRKTRAGAQQPVTSLDAITLFCERYAEIFSKLKQPTVVKLVSGIYSANGSSNTPSDSAKVMAKNLGVDADRLEYYLYVKMRDFRREIFEEGRGRLAEGTSAYAKTSGFDLDAENNVAGKHFNYGSGSARYAVTKKMYSPEEERFTKGAGSTEEAPSHREATPEKDKRSLPIPGDYASIQSIIKKHKLDGFLSKFAWFVLTNKVKFPEVSVASLLGIAAGSTDTQLDQDDDNWLY